MSDVVRRRRSPGSELDRIATLTRLLAVAPTPGVELAIGDDAAVVRARGRLVWTIDAAVEHVHFELGGMPTQDIGYRSFQAAVSDLAAMGARPLAALSNLCLPRDLPDREFERLVCGQAEAGRELECPIVGGNLTRGAELSLTTTVLGEVAKPLLRSGAKPGDELWLIGRVGMARAGYLASERRRARSSAALRACVAAFRRPRALLAEGRGLVGRARAALDVSDGLAGDAGQLARASGVRVVIAAEQLRGVLTPELVRAAAELGRDALELALVGGEDYALLAAGAPRRRPPFAARIGWIEPGEGAELELEQDRGRRSLGAGFDHFAPARR